MEGDPYIIANAEDLNEIGLYTGDWRSHFVIVNDIDMVGIGGSAFNIIGNYQMPFTGVFDGGGHVIYNFDYADNSMNSRIGLFGVIGGTSFYSPFGLVKNLGIENANVIAENSHTAGVLVGDCKGTLSGCYTSGRVRAQSYVGGLAGRSSGVIKNCYSYANVVGDGAVGGLCGLISPAMGNNNIVENCYSYGTVTAIDFFGGFSGTGMWSAGPGSIGCYWDIEASGIETSGEGSGRTTSQMKDPATFISFGFDQAWTIDPYNDYPRLAWQNLPGEFIEKHEFGAGDGTVGNPYQIFTTDDLNVIGSVRSYLDKHYVLMNDLDLGGYTGDEFNIIGGTIPFTGTFDGNGKIIHNFNYQTSGRSSGVGLFGKVYGRDAEIKNLGLVNPNVTALEGSSTGALVGELVSGEINYCFVEGGVVNGGSNVGGLVGSVDYNEGSGYPDIENSYAACQVAGYSEVGGLVGDNYKGDFTNCYARGNVSVTNDNGGGFAGATFDAYFSRCYSTGSVSGEGDIGGFLGRDFVNHDMWGTPVGASYYYVCYWDQQTSGTTVGVGVNLIDDNITIMGKTTLEMQTAATFNWNFERYWKICEGTNYPKLAWQKALPGDFDCPDGVGAEDLVIFLDCWLKDVNLDGDVSGDGVVNLEDMAELSQTWQVDCSSGCSSDVTADGNVNEDDLYVVTEQWLKTDKCKIADLSGDEFVNIQDFAIFAQNWLADTQ